MYIIRAIVLYIFLSSAAVSTCAQTDVGLGVQSGFNRIGLYFDSGIVFNLKQHQFKSGIRYYGPDYVFEKNIIGLSLGYRYLFKSNSWFFGPGISGAFFHENKSAVSLTVSDINLSYNLGYQIKEKLTFYSGLGIGAVVNQYMNISTASVSSTSYINYEFSLGINYFLRTHSNN